MNKVYLIVRYDTHMRLCQDKVWRDFANFGTEKICVKEYKSLAFAKRRAGHHRGASVVAIPTTHTVDASGYVYDENDVKHQITEFKLLS